MSVCERAATRLVAQNTEATVTCAHCDAEYGSQKVVARITVHGVWLWCRACKNAPLLTWAELDRLRQLLRCED
jgi:transcription elongation factor Elf1